MTKLQELRRVTKPFVEIAKEDKATTREVLEAIIKQNKATNKIDKDGNLANKIIITREQKDTIKMIASRVLVQEVYEKYDDLSNKDLFIAVRNAIHNSHYGRLEQDKATRTYGNNDTYAKIMELYKNIGWAIRGRQTEDIKPVEHKTATTKK